MAAVADQRQPDPQQGVFETLLVLDGRPVELDAHLARLEASLEALFPSHPMPDLSDVPGIRGPYGCISPGTSTAARAETGETLGMRLTVAPTRGDALEVRVSHRKVDRELVFAPLPVALCSLTLAGGLGAHKWADRSLLDEAQARLPADALPIVVDEDGAMLEASRANLFAVQGETMSTPPLDGRILPGVTRARLLEIAAAEGLETRETELRSDDLVAANEVFLTGSVRGVERVRSLDGMELAGDGEISSHLGTELLRTWVGAQVG
jgi:branched-subunit amino acid aminotransferase/4-amino-4-deoxychorismate lyase